METAIGMAFVFLTVSVVCMAVREIVADVLRLRASTLRQGIEAILNSPNARDVANIFYAHPVIQSLGQAGQGRWRAWRRQIEPSYISAAAFSAAIPDVLRTAARDAVTNELRAQGKTAEEIAAALRHHAETIGDSGVDLLLERGLDMIPGLRCLAAEVRARADTASNFATEFRTQLIGHFDEAMQRASGYYTRNTRAFNMLFGIVVAVVMNISAIHVAERLWVDDSVRALINSHANALVADSAPSQPNATNQPGTPNQSGAPNQPSATTPSQSILMGVSRARHEIETWPLPIGWRAGTQMPACDPSALLFLLGYLITGVAVSLGAQFWFGVLQNLMRIRGSIAPQPSPATPSVRAP